jgi:hypothetical protein
VVVAFKKKGRKKKRGNKNQETGNNKQMNADVRTDPKK